jgi:hypothetical protein
MILSVEEVFSADLPRDPRFASAVAKALRQLYAVGAAQSVRELVERE